MRTPQRLLIALLSIYLIAIPAVQTNAAVKEGASCIKAGQVKKSKGSSFVCTKKGKKLTWKRQAGVRQKGTALPESSAAPSPAPSPTPPFVSSPTPSPVPSLSPSAIKVDDQVNIKGSIVYGIDQGLLVRKSATGSFFDSDSRDVASFHPIRRSAYEAINSRSLNLEHPRVTFEYLIRPSFPKFLLPFIERELKYAAAFWNDALEELLKVRVYLVTEQDREFIKSVRWLQLNLPDKFDRFDSRKERIFISGGGAYWNADGNGNEGRIYLATASYLDPNFATNEWPQVARHEFVHVVQDYMMRKMGRERPSPESEFDKLQPQHFREGSANTISFFTAFRNIGWASDALDARLAQIAKYTTNWKIIGSEADAIEAMRATESRIPEGAFEMGYPLGALMYEWFIATYGMDSFIKLYQQLATAPSFEEAIFRVVGISKETFYSKAAPYIVSVFTRVNPYE